MAAQTTVPSCPCHSGMGFVYVCKTCEDQLLCIDCVTDRHNGHILGKLTDYLASQKQEIQKFADNLSKIDIPKTEGNIKEIGQQDMTHNGRYQIMIEDIKRQGNQIKNDIDRATDFMVGICSELQERNADTSEKNLRENLKPKLDRCQEVLTSGTVIYVTTLAREIRNGPTFPPTRNDLKNVEYQPGVISTEHLERMLGKLLVDGEYESCKPIPKCGFLYEFQMPFPYDTCRASLTGNEAWLSFWDSDTIYRVDVKGNVSERFECKVKVKSIFVSPMTGRLWFCVYEDRSIREITTDGDIVSRFNVSITPLSLCITSDDLVVVGMSGGIQLYTTDGQALSAAVVGPCKQVAVKPHHMTSCTLTGDVSVVDSDGVLFDSYMADKKPGKQPSVILMDKHLNLKFYCKDMSTRKTSGSDIQPFKFYPGDVCFDGAGDVLVAEMVTRSVLLIDRNTGHYMRTVYTSDGREPYCISLLNDCTLWVKLRGVKTTVSKYK